MAKFTGIAVLLVAVVALAEVVSAYRTTITTVVVEEENQRGRGQQQQQRCREQIQRQQLQHCELYLSQGSPYELALRSMLNQQEQHLRQCCAQLQSIRDEECQCEAIRELVRRQQQGGGGQWGGEEFQEVVQRARELPRRCNLRQQECQIRAVFV